MGTKRSSKRDYEDLEEIDDDEYEVDEEIMYARRKRTQKVIFAIFVVIILIIVSFYFLVVSPPGVLGIYLGDPELNYDKSGITIQADVALKGTGSAEGDGKLEVLLNGDRTYSGKIPIKSGKAKTELKFTEFITENGDYDIKVSYEGVSATLDNLYEVKWVVEKPLVILRRMTFTESRNLTKTSNAYFYMDINMHTQEDKPVYYVGPLDIQVDLKYEDQQTPFFSDDFKIDDESKTIVTKKYNYENSGNISAEVTVTNEHVKDNTQYKQVSGEGEGLINAPPRAIAKAEDNTIGLIRDQGKASFDASESFDPDGTIVNYLWDFDDESYTTTTEPYIEHEYTETGTYSVVVRVVDNTANDPQGWDEVIISITVSKL